jgi:BirA family biotin operon repressor/biotin-[acetyl-CoA-carboxylase] ligase
MKFTILRHETIGSTNDEALQQARRGAEEGLCIIASYQTAGRGRHGRRWVSPPGAGLHFSIILRPKIEMRFLPLITLMTGIAVHDTLEKTFDLECDIKWANDTHVKEKKISGILAESCETEKGLAVIVGIGINLRRIKDFPAELKGIMTSVEAESRKVPDFELLLESLTGNLANYYTVLHGEDGAAKIRELWTERSSYASGKAVHVISESETIRGVTDGIEENGALRVLTETGELKLVQAGDVEKLRKF